MRRRLRPLFGCSPVEGPRTLYEQERQQHGSSGPVAGVRRAGHPRPRDHVDADPAGERVRPHPEDHPGERLKVQPVGEQQGEGHTGYGHPHYHHCRGVYHHYEAHSHHCSSGIQHPHHCNPVYHHCSPVMQQDPYHCRGEIQHSDREREHLSGDRAGDGATSSDSPSYPGSWDHVVNRRESRGDTAPRGVWGREVVVVRGFETPETPGASAPKPRVPVAETPDSTPSDRDHHPRNPRGSPSDRDHHYQNHGRVSGSPEMPPGVAEGVSDPNLAEGSASTREVERHAR